MMSLRSRRRIGWLAMAAVLLVVFAVGVFGDRGVTTDQERAHNLAESLMCPTCRGQAVADSDSSAARGIRATIEQRIDEGASDEQIRQELADAYGDDILLTPGRSGLAGLVWVLPVAVLVAALAGLALAFRHWRTRAATRASEADRVMVARALTTRARDGSCSERTDPAEVP